MTIKSADPQRLREEALLVRVLTKLPGVDKKHKEASEELCRTKGVEDGAGKVIKQKFDPQGEVFKSIVTAKGLLRNTFLLDTGPWQDDGFRVVRAKKYASFREKIDALIAQCEALAEQFVKIWENEVIPDAKRRLGPLFEQGDYPSTADIRAAFRFEIETMVIPDHTHTVLDMDQDRIDRLVKETEELTAQRTQKLAEHVHEEVAEALEHVIAACREYGDEIVGAKSNRTRSFKDTIVPKLAQIADVLPGLNITGDPRLDKIASRIAGDLTVTDGKTLRGNKKGPEDKRSKEERDAEGAKAREEMADKAEDILDDLQNVFGD